MSVNPIYLYRRKGQDAFASCDGDRFEEVSRAVQLFETKIAYSDADYAALEAERDALRQQRDKLAGLLREAHSAGRSRRLTVDELYRIDAALAEVK